MAYLLNLVYVFGWLILSPWLCWMAWVRKRPVRGLWQKWLGRVDHPLLPPSTARIAWFHGVSVGEIHLLRQLVARFRARFPDWSCVISTTTSTGYDEACKHFADLPVVFWPFDFTWAVARALDTIRPALVVLSEGEIWPNFVRAAKQRGVKVVTVNGRMSPRSAARFQRYRWLLAGTFAQLDWIGAQNDEYREHYLQLGATRVITTGNLKYDGVSGDRHNAKTQAMRTLLRLDSDAVIWVAGSTQDPEEAVAIDIYRRAKAKHPRLRLVIVPRHPERFDEVARLLGDSTLPWAQFG